MLENTDLAVEEMARRCGFITAGGLRRHFVRAVSVSPHPYRQTFRFRARSGPTPPSPPAGA